MFISSFKQVFEEEMFEEIEILELNLKKEAIFIASFFRFSSKKLNR